MRNIIVSSIAIRGYRSFVEDKVVFPQTPGFKFLTGDNRVEPRLGANGAGKSSFWDAFSWCCWGVGIRGAKASAALNWDGAKQVEVIAEFFIDGEKHSLRRV